MYSETRLQCFREFNSVPSYLAHQNYDYQPSTLSFDIARLVLVLLVCMAENVIYINYKISAYNNLDSIVIYSSLQCRNNISEDIVSM